MEGLRISEQLATDEATSPPEGGHEFRLASVRSAVVQGQAGRD